MHLHGFCLAGRLDKASGEWIDVMMLSHIPEMAEIQIRPFACELAKALVQSNPDAIDEAHEKLSRTIADGEFYRLPPGRSRRGSTDIEDDAVNEWLITVSEDGTADRTTSRADVAFVDGLLEAIRASCSRNVRAIWPKWSDRWDRTRRGRRAVFVYTDRILCGLFCVGTDFAYRMYQDTAVRWSDLGNADDTPHATPRDDAISPIGSTSFMAARIPK